MTDVHTKQIRSYNMSMIKGRDTKPEIIVRKFLFHNGFRYRLNFAKLPGKPDIVLTKQKTVIFVNGCFWHGHEGCKYFVIPKTRPQWWSDKINRTKERDMVNYKKLMDENWEVIVIWECELRNNLENQLEKLKMKLSKDD